MVFRSLGFRLAFVVGLALAVGLGGYLTFLMDRHESDLVEMKREEAALLANVAKGALRHAMLQEPQPDLMEKMIPPILVDMAKTKEIQLLRLYKKLERGGGVILFSSKLDEVGNAVDLNADACVKCHVGGSVEPLRNLATNERTRIFSDPENGARLLGVIEPILNEEKCHRCHDPKIDILGVFDVVMTLDRMDANIARDARNMWLLGGAGALLILGVVVFLIQWFVQRPVKELVRGTEKIGQLELEHRMPEDRKDELGELSRSFNEMTARLKRARDELRSFSESLEEKVEEKTAELAAAQKQMVRAEKLAAVGHMAAGVAHEINNPLTGVITVAYLLKKKFPPDTREGQDLDMIIEEARRCSGIVRGLLDFAREGEISRRPAEPNRLLDRALSLVENQALFHNIKVVRDYQSDLPRFQVDPDRIEQVLLNLVLNAAEVMEGGGTLSLSTREVKGEQGFDRAVRITVADTGPGIPDEILGRIFDPFFTTKEPGKGTGLGLAVSYGIVDEHGGKIVVRSEPGEGATFTVYLPTGAPAKGEPE